MQRRELGQRRKLLQDASIDNAGLQEALAPMHDPMPNRIDIPQLLQRGRNNPLAAGSLQLALIEERIALIDHGELDRARAGVYDKNPHALTRRSARSTP